MYYSTGTFNIVSTILSLEKNFVSFKTLLVDLEQESI